MARESEKIPSSRARRTATVATLAASEAMKQFGTRAANLARGEGNLSLHHVQRHGVLVSRECTAKGVERGSVLGAHRPINLHRNRFRRARSEKRRNEQSHLAEDALALCK